MKNEDSHFEFTGTLYMPDGKPAPYVMLDDELCKFLRLDQFGLRNPKNTLRYYRRIGKLKSSRPSGHNVTTIEQAKEFMRNLEKK